MVLWKKESSSANACYIDFLSSFDQINRDLYDELKAMHGMLQKNETMTLHWRKQGNELFKAEKWPEAMSKYNDSICFAPNGSESLGLSYANRAACFLHLKMYDKCLVDIELAENANYPQNLMHKLDERKAACLKAMKESAGMDEKVAPPQLSYNPNKKFPGLADILEVRTNDEHGKHVVAKRDIDVGKIVSFEDAHAFVGNYECDHICKTCAKFGMNFIPCPNCFDVMFCNAECMESNTIHEKFCGASYNGFHSLNVETVFIGVSAFPDAASLMKFVEDALETRDVDSPKCESISQAKYRLFLKLFVNTSNMNAMGQEIFDAYKLAMEIPLMQQFFHSKREKRFLMHLIGQHNCILKSNSFSITDKMGNFSSVAMIAICSSLFNHSCTPNILHLIHGNKMIGYVQRPVKKGEQLFINYFKGKNNTSPGRTHNFQCKCSKCVPCWKEEDRMRIQMDPNFMFLGGNENEDYKNHKKRPVLKAKLQNLLSKYGRLPWSPELAAIENSYSKCCEEELSFWDY